MAETLTANLKLSKRDTGDLNWGGGHNVNFDLLDSHMRQATLPPPRILQAGFGSSPVGAQLIGGAVYLYKVTAINSAGETTERIFPSVLELRMEQPAIPLPINLQWETVQGATGYRVYKGTVSDQQKLLAEISGEASNQFTDDGNTSVNNSKSVPVENTALMSVHRILAGAGVLVEPSHGMGDVTISAIGGGGGGGSFPIEAPAGSLAAPSYSWLAKQNSGLAEFSPNQHGWVANGQWIFFADGEITNYLGSGSGAPFIQLGDWTQLRLPNTFIGQGGRIPLAFDDGNGTWNSGITFDSNNLDRLILYCAGNPVVSVYDNYLALVQIGSQNDPLMDLYVSNIHTTGAIGASGFVCEEFNATNNGVDLNGGPLIFDLDGNLKILAEYPSGKLWIGGGNTVDDNNYFLRFAGGNEVSMMSGGRFGWMVNGSLNDWIENGPGFQIHTTGGFFIQNSNNTMTFNYEANSGCNLIVSDDGGGSNLGRWEFRGTQDDDIIKLILMQNQVTANSFNGTGIVFGRDGNPHFDIISRSSSSVYLTVQDYYGTGQGELRDPAIYFDIKANGSTNLSHYDFLIEGNLRLGIHDADIGLMTASGSELRLDDVNNFAHLAVPQGHVINLQVGADISAEFDGSTATDEMRFLLWDASDGTLKRVKRGAPDSGGSGYRSLVVVN